MKNPLISIIVPIYKIDRFIGVCIESILNQTYKNLEIILVDDGSPDRCPEICDLYARKDSRIKVIHKQNGGLVSARKAGILAAQGEYIGYVDGDDWISPKFYESLYTSIKDNNADVSIAGFSRDLFDKRDTILNSIPSGVYVGLSIESLKKQMISVGPFFTHGITTYLWNKLFRREVIVQHQLACDERITIGEDAAVTYPTLMDCTKIVITDNCDYHYRQREDSMLKQSSNYQEEYMRLLSLYNFMKQELGSYPEKYNLLQQTEDLILSTYIIRSGGTLDCSEPGLDIFPFKKELEGQKIIVYGAGTFGQQLVRRIKIENTCNIVAWIDNDYWEYRRCCMDVDPIEEINKYDFDRILIAKLSDSAIKEIKNLLMNHGVDESSILSVSIDPMMKKKVLNHYISLSNGNI